MAKSFQRTSAKFLFGFLLGILLLAGLVFPGPASSYGLTASLVDGKFVSSKGNAGNSFKFELASTPPARMLGLMYRKDMAEDAGMIFIFPDMKPRSFWMKDTYLSLDMVFLNDKLEVVAIIQNVPILNTQPRESKVPAQYVVELNAGTAAKNGIEIGSKLTVSKPLPEALE